MKKLLTVIASLLVLSPVAFADDVIVEDADDSAGRLDIKSVEVSHPDSGTIRFVVTFYEPHRFTPGAGYEPGDRLEISLQLDGRRPWRYRRILVQANPDGGLYGVLRNPKGHDVSYVRTWRVDDVSLAVEITRRQLRPRELARRADWLVLAAYLDHETYACADEAGDVPSSCQDWAPENGFQRHDL